MSRRAGGPESFTKLFQQRNRTAKSFIYAKAQGSRKTRVKVSLNLHALFSGFLRNPIVVPNSAQPQDTNRLGPLSVLRVLLRFHTMGANLRNGASSTGLYTLYELYVYVNVQRVQYS